MSKCAATCGVCGPSPPAAPPPAPCADVRAAPWCAAKARNGRCRFGSVVSRCALTCGACVGGCGDARPALCARRTRSATLTCERDAERRKCARSCGVCESS